MTVPEAASTTSSSSSPAEAPTTAALLEKLQTAEGQKLLGELVKTIAPAAAVREANFDPPTAEERAKLPTDRFEAALVQGIWGRFNRPGEVRDNTVAVLAAEFAHLGDKDGAITAEAVQKALGPKGLQFFQALSSVTSKSGDPLADRRSFDPISQQTAALIAGQDPIAPAMSALDTMVRQVAKKDEFKGLQFMGLQHLFASSATLFGAINGLGVKHEDMRLIGKVYSTNHRVVSELESRGAVVDNVSKKVGVREFGAAMEEGIEWQLRQIIDTLPQPNIFTAEGRQFSEKPTPRVLLIDDGAEAIKVLHEKFPEHAPFFVCVEQTRRGARILHDLAEKGELKCAVANVAETWAKLEWESPMIGHSVVLEVDRKLDRLTSYGVKEPKESLVLGCGAVGGGVARAMLRRGMDVHLYDKDPARTQALHRALIDEGFDPSKLHAHEHKQDALTHAQVLVSCVGVRTLERDDHDFLPNGAILVNAASADDELGPQDLLPFRRNDVIKDERGNLWGAFQGRAINTGKADAEAHSDAVVHHQSGKEFLVVNNGYVVNMTGERDPIPPRYIQLTRTLLLLGAITANRASAGADGGVGLHDVPKEWQEALVHLVQRDLKKSGEDLKAPTWDAKQADAPAPEEVLTPPPAVVAIAEAEAAGRPAPPTGDEQKLAEAQARAKAKPGDGDHGAGFIDTTAQEQAQPRTRLYGYRLGRTIEGSKEAVIARLIGSGRELTLPGAALYAASRAVGALLGAQLRVSLAPPQQLETSPFVDKTQVQHVGPQPIRGAGDDTDVVRFGEHFGHNCRLLVSSVLTSRLKRPPTEEEIGSRLKVLFEREPQIDAGPWLASLGRSPDPADQRLRAALVG